MPLIGFAGDTITTEGKITLPVTVGTEPRQSTVSLTFAVAQVPSAYNAILGRPGLNALRAIVSTYHLLVRFPTKNGVGKMRGDQQLARRCFQISVQSDETKDPLTIDKLDQREEEERGSPAEQLEAILIGENSDRKVWVGSQLPDTEHHRLAELLTANADIFAWSAADMSGIPPETMTHRLNIDPTMKPVRQKKRSFAPERQKAIDEEVDKLLEAGFIRESTYPDWLANVIMVKKANGKWRICIAYIDLNRACPKDSFPLPKIDQLVDATSEFRLLSFMDAFAEYNQIRMAPEDEEIPPS